MSDYDDFEGQVSRCRLKNRGFWSKSEGVAGVLLSDTGDEAMYKKPAVRSSGRNPIKSVALALLAIGGAVIFSIVAQVIFAVSASGTFDSPAKSSSPEFYSSEIRKDAAIDLWKEVDKSAKPKP